MTAAPAPRPGIVPAHGLSHVAGRTDVPLSDATIHGLLATTDFAVHDSFDP